MSGREQAAADGGRHGANSSRTRPGSPHPPAFGCSATVLLRAAVRPARPLTGPAEGPRALAEAAGDPLLREAVALASPSLAAVLDKAAAGTPLSPKEIRRAARALAGYRLRMNGRATPFGLVAGVAAAGFAAAPAARWGSAHTKHAGPDLGWLHGVVDALESDPAVLALLRVTANDLCTVRGDRLVLPFVPDTVSDASGQPLREVTVRHTEAVRQAVALCARPVAWNALRDRLRELHPAASARTVEAMLTELVRRGLLLTELRPPQHAADPLAHILGLLTPHQAALPPATARTVRELGDIHGALAAYAQLPPGAGPARLDALRTRMRALNPAEAPVRVDLALDARVTLPQALRDEAERAAGLLATLSAGRPGPHHLRAYHTRFLERYGTGRAVPLRELLDPERGLGLPAGYGPTAPAPPRAGGPTARDRLLLARAQETTLAGGRELALDTRLMTALRETAEETDGPDPGAPPSFDLLTEVLAASVEAMAAGEFTLVVRGVSTVAGAVAGRFGHLLGPAAEDFARAVRATPTRNPRAVPAQLAFRTRTGRAANVSAVPRWLEHTITVAAWTDRTAPHTLDLADLSVVAEPGRLALVSHRLDREIVPVLPSMLLPHGNIPALARFLAELPAGGEAAPPGWDWGTAAALPHLPRVRSGRTVLAPARWRPAEPALHTARTEAADWRRLFDEWRERCRVPDHVVCADGDHRIPLDLTDPAQRELLRHEWRRRPTAVLEEQLADGPHGRGWSGGRPAEIAFPLVRTTPGTAPPPAVPRVHRPRPTYGPGSPWLHAKLYCAPEHQDTVLTRELPALLEHLPPGVDRWFYLRYTDPDPHLRLRFHSGPHTFGGRLLPRLGRWADRLAERGLCGRLLVDGYTPEWERYGGPEAMAAAEALFEADSHSCLTQLTLLRTGTLALDRRLLTAADHLDLLHRFGAGPRTTDELLLTGRPERHRPPAGLRDAARRLLDPGGHWHALGELPGGAELLAAWQRRAPAVTAYRDRLRLPGAAAWTSGTTALAALLHLHHNRLAGSDRRAEEEALALARTAVRAHRDRERAHA
ncbi:lantibiotic dehydratase [Streptomyces gamaensis]|uniref:Lantibiotic dehydratase n=1 Tax=Streptomyces gamaensis TaxID=1763542 RepID=A0ABW0YYL1_9ACTN